MTCKLRDKNGHVGVFFVASPFFRCQGRLAEPYYHLSLSADASSYLPTTLKSRLRRLDAWQNPYSQVAWGPSAAVAAELLAYAALQH